MTGFPDLAVAATLGCASRRVDLAGLPGEISVPGEDARAGGAGAGGPAPRLLDAAAQYATARRARVRPAAPSRPEAPPPEIRPAVPPRLAGVVQRLAGDPELLSEAVRLVAARGLRLSPSTLVRCLEGADEDRWAVLEPVAGQAGAWLFAKGAFPGQRPRLSAQERWARATEPEARAAALRELRAADPALGRELLEQELAVVRPRERAALLPALEVGLGAEDLPLLTGQWEGKAAGPRAAARDLLARLPGSAVARQHEAWAAEWITVQRRLARSPRLVLGGEGPPDAERWGIPRDSAPAHVLQVVSRVPPDSWPRLLGLDVLELAALLEAAGTDPWPHLRTAALTFRHRRLASVIVHRPRQVRRAGDRSAVRPLDQDLLRLLERPEQERLVAQALRSPEDRRPWDAVAALAAPLPAAVWRAWLERLVREAPTGGSPTAAHWRMLLHRVGPADLTAVGADLRELTARGDGAAWRAPLHRAVETLTLRSALHEELS